MSEPVKYLTDEIENVTFGFKPVRRVSLFRLLPGQGADGYGSKISTDYTAKIGNRTHRVYLTIHSNVGSNYVIVKGEKLFLHDYDLDGIREEPT